MGVDADAKYVALLTPLQSYHALLRGSVSAPSEMSEDPDNVLWLTITGGCRVTQKVLNGLELLAMVAHVDWEVWTQCVSKIWKDCELGSLVDMPARVGIDLHPGMEGRCEPVLEMLATSAQDHAQAPDVVKAREAFRAILHERGLVVADIPVRVTWYGAATVGSMIFKVMQTVVTRRFLVGLDGSESTQRYQGLRIRVFCPGVTSVALSATELQHLSTIAADGAGIQELGTVKPEAQQHHPTLFATSLWTLYAIGSSEDLRSQRGIKQVAFKRCFRADMIPGLYSAIQASPSVESVTVHPAIDSKTPKKYSQQVWVWIAYALFCQVPSSVHRVRSVSLDVEKLRAADVELMIGVIQAPDPITKLFTRAASLAGDAISASRFRLRDPAKDCGSENDVVESPHLLSDLPVLKRSKEWTSVLLPAWGQAWVHSKDVVAKQRWSAGPFPIKPLDSVEFIGISKDSRDAVLALLRVVGAGIKHLVLKSIRDENDVRRDDWLAEILDICRNLESLEIRWMKLNSLQSLLDAFESGKCRLTRFKATHMTFSSVDDSLRRLFVALGDPAHPAARYMSEFACDDVKIATMRDPVMVATAVGMLEKNERLRDLEIGLHWNDPDNQQYEACVEPFKVFDKQKISRPLAPIDRRQRIAFLSVITPRRDRRRRPRAIEKLDACVLSSIFEMATTCCERRVHVGYIRQGYW